MSTTITALFEAYRAQVKDLPVLPREVLADADMDLETASALIDARAAERDAVASQVFGGHKLSSREISAATAGRPVHDHVERYALIDTYGADRVTHVPNVGWFLDLPADLREQATA